MNNKVKSKWGARVWLYGDAQLVVYGIETAPAALAKTMEIRDSGINDPVRISPDMVKDIETFEYYDGPDTTAPSDRMRDGGIPPQLR